MAIYKAGRFLVDGDTFNLESDYVGKEYDAAKKELERISNSISKIYQAHKIEEFRVITRFYDYNKKFFLFCACDKKGIITAKFDKRKNEFTTIFSAEDTKEIAKISDYFLTKAENIVRLIEKNQYISQSIELEKISIEYIRQKMKKEVEEYENGR